MDKPKNYHLSFLTIYDAAHKRKRIKPHQWAHLKQCEKCTLRLASMLQVSFDLQDLNRRYSAA